jgi:hypothetical protein
MGRGLAWARHDHGLAARPLLPRDVECRRHDSLPRPVPRKDSSMTTFSMTAYGDADRVILGSRSSRTCLRASR